MTTPDIRNRQELQGDLGILSVVIGALIAHLREVYASPSSDERMLLAHLNGVADRLQRANSLVNGQ